MLTGAQNHLSLVLSLPVACPGRGHVAGRAHAVRKGLPPRAVKSCAFLQKLVRLAQQTRPSGELLRPR